MSTNTLAPTFQPSCKKGAVFKICPHECTEYLQQLCVEWESDLWWDIDKSLTEQQANVPRRVLYNLLKLLLHGSRAHLLTLSQNQVLNLLHTLHTLLSTHTLISLKCLHRLKKITEYDNLLYILECFKC